MDEQRVFRGAERALFAAGTLLLGWFVFVTAEARLYQYRQERALESAPEPSAAAMPGTSSAAVRRAGADAADCPPAGAERGLDPLDPLLLGRLEIPRLGVAALVLEGTGEATLRRAIGHIAGTSVPGAPGNVGLAAHRDTFFRRLEGIRPRDRVTFRTLSGDHVHPLEAGEYPQGLHVYRVDSIRIVEPTDVAVLKASGEETLTLVTCYPFRWVGPAPKRFVVRAVRVPSRPLGSPGAGGSRQAAGQDRQLAGQDRWIRPAS